MTNDPRNGSAPLLSRRQMLAASGKAALAGLAAGVGLRAQQRRPRIAVVVTYWAAPGSHADWIITKLMDGYWWKGQHVDSRVEVVSAFIHQLDLSPLGRRVCESKGVRIYDKVSDALTLGGDDLAVDGVVLVGEHGNYHTNLLEQKYYPRWWLYQQIVQVFEKSNRSVPVFNDKHLSTSWDEAKWMYNKSRELDFPLFGGSSIPFYFRKPEVDLEAGTPLKYSVVAGGSRNAGGLFHAVDVLQSFVEMRKGGETGVASVQCIHGDEVWKWTERNAWAGNLLDEIRKSFDFQPLHFEQNSRQPTVTIVDYRDGTRGAVYTVRDVGWTYAGEIEGKSKPMITSMLNWPGPYAQYHAANAFEHWIVEMMLTRKEPYNAERLLLSTGITGFNMQSNWENGEYLQVGRVIETPYMDMRYRPTRGSMFNTGERPPVRPYIRGFAEADD